MTTINEWLDTAEADAHRKVTLGQPVVRELDRLLANDRANLVRAIAALRAVLEEHGRSGYWCSTCEEYGQAAPYPCPTVKAIAEALRDE